MTIRISKMLVYGAGLIVLLILVFVAGRRTIDSTSSIKTTNKPLNRASETLKNNQAGQVREIEVTAKQFEFSPNPIRVRLGETVRLRLTSVDVIHGFSLPEFGIEETLRPGKTVTVEFQATKKGNFSFVCSVACGSGHANMRGLLVVE